jgi:hypothetical protein
MNNFFLTKIYDKVAERRNYDEKNAESFNKEAKRG